jgi:hypothetical protein
MAPVPGEKPFYAFIPPYQTLPNFCPAPPRDATPGKVMITSDSPMHPFDLRSYPDLSKTDNQLLIIDDPREMRFQSISLSCVIASPIRGIMTHKDFRIMLLGLNGPVSRRQGNSHSIGCQGAWR